MKAFLIAVCLVSSTAFLRAEEAPATPAQEAQQEHPKILQDGNTYVFSGSSKTANVETEEYVLEGEQITNWSQLVTMQRLSLSHAGTVEDFCTYFAKRIAQEGSGRVDIVKKGPRGTVFVASFPASAANEEQIMLCLVLQGKTSNDLMMLQFAIKAGKVSKDVAAAVMKGWRDRLCAQADK